MGTWKLWNVGVTAGTKAPQRCRLAVAWKQGRLRAILECGGLTDCGNVMKKKIIFTLWGEKLGCVCSLLKITHQFTVSHIR